MSNGNLEAVLKKLAIMPHLVAKSILAQAPACPEGRFIAAIINDAISVAREKKTARWILVQHREGDRWHTILSYGAPTMLPSHDAEQARAFLNSSPLFVTYCTMLGLDPDWVAEKAKKELTFVDEHTRIHVEAAQSNGTHERAMTRKISAFKRSDRCKDLEKTGELVFFDRLNHHALED